jgi:exodeoxyribonuclease-3
MRLTLESVRADALRTMLFDIEHVLTRARKQRSHCRIAVWNCSMAFSRKLNAASSLDADVLIIPECARADCLLGPSQSHWVGEKAAKGLGIFVRQPLSLEPLFSDSAALPVWAVPFRISDETYSFDLLAVWDYNHRSARNARGAVLDAVHSVIPTLRHDRLVVAGDFNSNVIWDKSPTYNHRSLVTSLKANGLASAYHHARGELQGKEREPTIYWRWHEYEPYHIDYIFVPASVADDTTVSIGTFAQWTATGLSDHVPITADIPWRFALPV